MQDRQTRLVWFRRDLRVDDHAALHHALRAGGLVWCVFVFDTEILDELLSEGWTADRRVEFIHASIVELDAALRALGGGLIVRTAGHAIWCRRWRANWASAAVASNRDYEPAALLRDGEVGAELARHGIAFEQYKDQVIFECDEVLTLAHKPFSVFTPYKNAWLKKLTPFQLQAYAVRRYAAHWPHPRRADSITGRHGLRSDESCHAETACRHVRARMCCSTNSSTASTATRQRATFRRPRARAICRCICASERYRSAAWHAKPMRAAAPGAEGWLNELIWRDFYFQILWHNPRVLNGSFRPEFDAVRWVDDEEKFRAWCEGRTGFPLVDAAQRQLAQTGYMHNRLRMVSASFLTKDLGISWRRGEHWFARNLNDFDLAANNGGWQWAASTGCDAQPWFRIFNPVTQSEKFDADGQFIRRYCPELAKFDRKRIHAPWLATPLEQQMAGCVIGRDYPAPVVDHALAREATLERVQGGERAADGNRRSDQSCWNTSR
jgi:deoxyribodipyrimidine photo-lyase